MVLTRIQSVTCGTLRTRYRRATAIDDGRTAPPALTAANATTVKGFTEEEMEGDERIC